MWRMQYRDVEVPEPGILFHVYDRYMMVAIISTRPMLEYLQTLLIVLFRIYWKLNLSRMYMMKGFE
jgi:hypothetical protein